MEKQQRPSVDSIPESAPLLVLSFVMLSFLGFLVWIFATVFTEADAINKAPFLKTTALITSKDPDQNLSVKSTDLPRKGDVVAVDQYAYGSVAVGDSICVQYKQLSDEPQYNTEFVDKGVCQK